MGPIEDREWRREPVFLIPGAVVALTAVLVAIHVVRTQFLSAPQDFLVLVLFAFIPARYAPGLGATLPGGFAADAWTFLTYAFLHGSVTHLMVNLLWLVAFGTAVARRLASVRFLLLSALCAVAGAAVHLALHFGEMVPVVGASAAISGQMAVASRFVFDRGAPLGAIRGSDPAAYRRPAARIGEVLTNYRAMAFVVVWFAINLLIGLTPIATMAGGANVAWEAHVGGFLAGFLLFPLFDPVGVRGTAKID